MEDLLTIVYGTSPHRLGASCSMIKLSCELLRATELRDCKFVICTDQINPNSRFANENDIENYKTYIKSVKKEIPYAKVLESDQHIGLTKNYEQAWNKGEVNTPFVLLMNHDTVLTDAFLDIDIKSILTSWPEEINLLSFPRHYARGWRNGNWWRPEPLDKFIAKTPEGEWQNCMAAFGAQDNCTIMKASFYKTMVKDFYKPTETHFIEDSLQEYISKIRTSDAIGWGKLSGAVYAKMTSMHLDGQSKAGESYDQESGRGGEGVWSDGYLKWTAMQDLKNLTGTSISTKNALAEFSNANLNFYKKECHDAFGKAFDAASKLSIASKSLQLKLPHERKNVDQSGAAPPISSEKTSVHIYISPHEVSMKWENEENKKLLLKLHNKSRDKRICWGGHPLGNFRTPMGGDNPLSKNDSLNVKLYDYTTKEPPHHIEVQADLDLRFCTFTASGLRLSARSMSNRNPKLHLSRKDGSQIPFEQLEDGTFLVKYKDFKGSPTAIGFFHYEFYKERSVKSWTFECAPMRGETNPIVPVFNSFQHFMQEVAGEKRVKIPWGSVTFWERSYEEVCNQLELEKGDE